jgi:hypothetical protein
LGIALAFVVVEGDGLEVAGVFDDEVDGGAAAFGVVDGCAEQGWGEGSAVDGDDLEAGSDACFVGDTADDDIANGAGGACREAEGVDGADAIAFG